MQCHLNLVARTGSDIPSAITRVECFAQGRSDVKIAIVLLTLACCCWSQTSNRDDGNTLLTECGSALRFADAGFKGTDSDRLSAKWCLGYLDGFVGGFKAMEMVASKTYEEYLRMSKTYVCFPEHSTLGQDMRVVVKFLQDHPERLHEDEEFLVFKAFQAAYPCESTSRKSN